MTYEIPAIPVPKKTHGKPIATYALIIINVAIYLISSFNNFFVQISDEWVNTFSYVPILIYVPTQWYRIITSMFLHGDLFHIFFNMLFLYWFGKELELLLGSKKFLILYFASGISATIFHTAFIPITGSISLIIPAIGASGAISGLLGAYMLTYPGRRLSICWFFVFIPLCFTTTAAVFLLFWFAMQVIYGYLRFGGVAFFAHVGGFIAGLALIYLLKRSRKAPSEYFIPIPLPFEFHEPQGLGSTAKFLLSLLLLAIIGGGIYSAIAAPNASSMYIVNISACSNGTCESDEGAYTPVNDETVTPSKELPRIAFNRIVWSGIIRASSPSYCNGNPIEINRRVNIKISGYTVATILEGSATYDSNCVLVEFVGRIATQVVKVHPILGVVVGVSKDPIILDNVVFTSQDVAKDIGEVVIRPLALLASLLTAASMAVVVFKDRELVEDEYFFMPMPGPYI